MKLPMLTWSVTAVLVCASAVYAAGDQDAKVEQSTVSPVANMSLEGEAMQAPAVVASTTEKTAKEVVKQHPADSQQHTIADFIIHPLIALKPRLPATEKGKQAAAASSSSSTPSPWQLFNFSPAQSLGSSVSSLAGTVTGWLGNRIQLPALVDTPVRESANTATTTTTTTATPDIVVKIQQRPSKQKPSNNNRNRPLRKNKRPNRFYINYEDYSDENDYLSDYDDVGSFNGKRRRYQIYEDDDYENEDNNGAEAVEDDDDDEEEYAKEDEQDDDDEIPVRQQVNRVQKPVNLLNSQRRRLGNQQQQQQQLLQDEINQLDQYNDNDDDDNDQDIKRSENELNFIQRGQQNLMKQLKQFARGQTPAEVATNSLHKTQMAAQNKRRPQQAALLLINHRGQTFYLPSELLQVTNPAPSSQRYTPQYPAAAYKRKTPPSQYISIPWSQLGMSPHEQVVSQRLILKIPPQSKDNIQIPGAIRKKPSSSANAAVPLVSEASPMKDLRPSRIPPTRAHTTSRTTLKPSAAGTAVAKPAAPTRIAPAKIQQMAPALEDSSESLEDETNSSQYIVIGDESVAKKFTRNNYREILNYFKQNRVGRQLNDGSTNEQLIPVHIVTGEEEPFKDLNTNNDNLQANSASVNVAHDSKQKIGEEVKVEKPGQMMAESAVTS